MIGRQGRFDEPIRLAAESPQIMPVQVDYTRADDSKVTKSRCKTNRSGVIRKQNRLGLF
jgi:hypothetical protein